MAHGCFAGNARTALAVASLLIAVTGSRDAAAREWPTIPPSADAAKVLAAFKRGPYGKAVEGWIGYQTLVPGIYAIMDPNGKYAPIFTDARITRMKNGSNPWLDVASGKKLTAAQARALRRDMAATLQVNQAITFTYGSGKSSAILVSAYDCPYCRKLEQALDAGQVDATVHLFPMALQHNRSAPMAVARDIWCSAEPGPAWKATILNQQAPDSASSACKKDARATSMLMALFDIKGVPARIHADGRVTPFQARDLK